MARRDSDSLDRDDVKPYTEHHRTPSLTSVPGNTRSIRATVPPPPTSSSSAGLPRYHSGPGSSSNSIAHPTSSAGARDGRAGMPSPGYTVMFAGRSVGKTSLLRLFLDTLDISPRTSPAQAEDVARFVYGSAGRTTAFCQTSIEVLWDFGSDGERPILLNLIDTPAVDSNDPAMVERSISDIIRIVESKFMDSIDDELKYHSGDHHVHLCLYLLDPDTIVPLPPSKQLPGHRTRTDGYGNVTPADSPTAYAHPHHPHSAHQHQSHNSVPHLPVSEVHAIRTLSQRVNVLPVIARADTVTAERLAAIKRAVREDLADAGIGFGIFDNEQQDAEQRSPERDEMEVDKRMRERGCDEGIVGAGPRLQHQQMNGKGPTFDEREREKTHLHPHSSARPTTSTTASSAGTSTHRDSMSSSVSSMTAGTSPPASPFPYPSFPFPMSKHVEPSVKQPAQIPRLPHAVLSPDAYAHGEGFVPCSVAGHGGVASPTMQELIKRYTPGYSPNNMSPTLYEVRQGRFLRQYRWGSVDPLNPKHCDFLHLRTAVFHQMQPLRAYTCEYLFNKFRDEIHLQRQHLGVGVRHSVSHRANASLSASASASVSPVPHSKSVHPTHHPMQSNNHNFPTLPPPTPHKRPSSAASSVHPLGESGMSRLGTTSLPPLANIQHNPQSQQLPPLSAVTSAASDYDFDGDHEDYDGRYARHNRGNGGSMHSRRPPSTGSLALSPDMPQSTGRHHMAGPLSSISTHGRPLHALNLPPHPHPHARGQHPNGTATGPYNRPSSALDDEMRPPSHSASAPASAGDVPLSSYGFKSSDASKQRNKKITVACNFCRSRKLKCDGIRPACGQCIKRQNGCDYMPQTKRRGTNRHRHSNSGSGNGNDDDGDGDGSGDASSGDELPPHSGRPYEDEHGRVLPGLRISDVSADSMHESSSRRGSGNGDSFSTTQYPPRHAEHDRDTGRDAHIPYANSYPPPNNMHRNRSPYPPSPHGQGHALGNGHGMGNGSVHEHVSPSEKHQLSPLPYAGSNGGLSPAGNGGMSGSPGGTSPGGLSGSAAQSAPVPIRPASDAQATQRKRQTANGTKGGARASSNYGPKVVACNFCRARKTKCDGVHPSCASCARRSLPCSYANDGSGGRGRRSGAAAAAAAAAANAQNTASATTPATAPAKGITSPNTSQGQSPGHDSVHSAIRSADASPPGSKRGFSDDEGRVDPHKRPRIDNSEGDAGDKETDLKIVKNETHQGKLSP